MAKISKTDKYLRAVVKMSPAEMFDQTQILRLELEERLLDPVGHGITARLLAAVEAIGDARFTRRWRIARMAIDHIDGDIHNNTPSNLRFVTLKENHR